MYDNLTSLSSLSLGKVGKIKSLQCDGMLRRRMLDLGLIDDTVIEALYKSPSGDPTAYYVRGAVIAIRSEEAEKILVELN
ncbi:ferrous iron transport protein A [Clostridium collagenovorans DSM 3089]|uniref:Ferrous iron transport protein A n=1 Tax=Clostridium collagenovorans DSM 3089 TaxID=1121306 RepID=A0A1M5SM75_9CLOT|nr:FeoA family protein [Clostridium collagenovorans]SHH39013.1 ferrous iron transport protein A [Clostridium collagenovorans DSM 3089]